MVIAIIGGGLAGLVAALRLHKEKQQFLLFEQSPELGGKLKTFNFNGYQLDLGFQVLLSAYPSLKGLLTQNSFTELNPCYFEAGALLLKDGQQHVLSDPLQEKKDALRSIFCPLVSFSDKFRTLLLKHELSQLSLNEILDCKEWKEQLALDFLADRGFSLDYLNNFAKPFFGGVFGSNSLNVAASNFAFCFKAFAEGKVFIPAKGIQELPRVIQSQLPSESLHLNSKVVGLKKTTDQELEIKLENGRSFTVKAVILATEIENALTLYDLKPPSETRASYHNLYFLSKTSLYKGKKIFLNCNFEAVINNGVQLSNISACLAHSESNEHLISTTVLRKDIPSEQLPDLCLRELEDLFPQAVGQIQFIKHFEIKDSSSLLKQEPKANELLKSSISKLERALPKNVILAGEYLHGCCSQETSIQSGFKAADEALQLVTEI